MTTESNQNLDAAVFLGGNFIKKEDLAAGEQRFVIRGSSTETFEAKNGNAAEDVLQLQFDDGLRFNLSAKINLRIVMGAYGRQTAGWIGKPVILYVDPNVMFSGRLVGGIRVRIPDQQG